MTNPEPDNLPLVFKGAHPGEEKRILIAADKQLAETTLKDPLFMSGHTIVDIVQSGEAAVERARSTLPDLLLVDFALAGPVDGLSASRQINEENGIPVVCLATQADAAILQRAELAEPFSILLKPFRPNDLRLSVDIALYRAGLERKLRVSEARYRMLAENISDVIFALDTNRRFSYVSPSVTRSLGFTVEEFLMRSPEDLLQSVDDARALSATLYSLAEKGERSPSASAELAFRHKKGSTVWAEVTASLRVDPQGHPVEIIGVARDITERRQKEEALRVSEEKFSRAFRISPDSININRLSDGVYIDVNEGFTKVTGYTASDVIGRSSRDGDLGIWVHNEDRENLVQTLKDNGEVIGFKAPFRRKDGSVLFGLMSARVLRINQEDCILTITRDLTNLLRVEEELRHEIAERKQIAEELKKREQMLQSVMNYIPDCIFWKDNASVYQGCNRNFALSAGVDLPENIVGRSDYDLPWKREESDLFREIDRMVMESNQPMLRVVESQRQASGKDAWIETNRIPMVDGNGEVTGVLGTYHDITAQKETEDRIKTALREKEILLREVHHRVKNNMQVIISLLNLQGSYVHDARDLEIFRDTQQRVRSMALIHERLYQSDSLATVDFGRYLLELSSALQHAYSRSGIAIVVDATNVWLEVDVAIPCGLIVNELVSNALKHAFNEGQPGTIRIQVRWTGENEYTLIVTRRRGWSSAGFLREGGGNFRPGTRHNSCGTAECKNGF